MTVRLIPLARDSTTRTGRHSVERILSPRHTEMAQYRYRRATGTSVHVPACTAPYVSQCQSKVGRKVGGYCAPFCGGGAGSPSNTMSPGLRAISIPSGILIYPAVWPQYTNVTDRTDRQRSDSVWRTVLQTVAQKRLKRS